MPSDAHAVRLFGLWSAVHVADSILDVHAVELVRIGPEEWREFREVRLASLIDAPGAFKSRHADWVDAGEARWRARLTDVPFTVVARSDEGTVGVVSGAETDRAVELLSMWVAPPQRGTGLAAQLMDEVVSWARSRGRRTFLMVRHDNVPAIRAYSRAGFQDAGVPEDWPDDLPPERRMWHGGETVQREV